MARHNRRAEFNPSTFIGHGAGEPITLRAWPSDDIAFLAAILEAHHVPASLIQRIATAAALLPLTTPLLDRLSMALADQIHFAPLSEVLRAPVLLLFGPSGAGKTTLAARLAARLSDRRVLLVGTDVDDTHGVTYLKESAAVLGVPVTTVSDTIDLKRIIAEAAGRPVVIDTRSIGPGDNEALAKLAALTSACGAEPILVLSADSATEEAMAMAHSAARLPTHMLIPTRLDLAHCLGGTLAAAHAGRLALAAGGATPHFAYGLHSLTSSTMARRLLAAALSGPRWRSAAAEG